MLLFKNKSSWIQIQFMWLWPTMTPLNVWPPLPPAGSKGGRYLSDGHGAEDVKEDKGAVRVILPQQVAVRQPLDVGKGHEWQLGHDSSVKAEQNKWEVFHQRHKLRFGQIQTTIPHRHRRKKSGHRWTFWTFYFDWSFLSIKKWRRKINLINFVRHLHGVEHAHQRCEAEAYREHWLHAHLQTKNGNLKSGHIWLQIQGQMQFGNTTTRWLM